VKKDMSFSFLVLIKQATESTHTFRHKVEPYSHKALRLIGSFLDEEITLDECLAGLNTALVAVTPVPTGDDLDKLHAQARWNRRVVMEA
jgi:hypothetical protein